MNLFRAISFSLLLTWAASALSLFPELTTASVAATTNREVARGIAFDGTNFLVVLQGDNLYAGGNPTNQLAAQRLSVDGTLLGSRSDLQLNGSIPLVAFGTSNYLMVWADPAGAEPGVYGQRLDRSGTKLGGAFLVASNSNVGEVGGLVFAHEEFCAVWSATNAASNAGLIQAQRLSPSGDLLGPVLAVGAAASADQRFPHLDTGATNFFLTWVAQRSDTNAWDVVGRSIDAAGSASPEFVISQTPAGAPYPVASAFDGTNHLVVWSREAGPSHSLIVGYDTLSHSYLTTNIFFPMMFGRVTGESNGAEFSISRARWGQVSPTVAFDGTNYLVAWNDHRYSGLSHLDSGPGLVFNVTNQTLFFQFVSRTGALVETEFTGLFDPYSFIFDYGSGARTPPTLRFGGGRGALLFGRSSRQSREADDVRLISLSSPNWQPPRLTSVGITNGMLGLQIVGPTRIGLTVFVTTNLNNWPSATNFVYFGPLRNVFDDSQAIHRVDIPVAAQHAFFRAVNGVEGCKSNLRRMLWAKEQWALDHDKIPSDLPTSAELHAYAPESWVCPNTGTYVFNSVNSLSFCTFSGHVPP